MYAEQEQDRASASADNRMYRHIFDNDSPVEIPPGATQFLRDDGAHMLSEAEHQLRMQAFGQKRLDAIMSGEHSYRAVVPNDIPTTERDLHRLIDRSMRKIVFG